MLELQKCLRIERRDGSKVEVGIYYKKIHPTTIIQSPKQHPNIDTSLIQLLSKFFGKMLKVRVHFKLYSLII